MTEVDLIHIAGKQEHWIRFGSYASERIIDRKRRTLWGRVAKAALISTILGIGAELGNGSSNDIARAIRQGTQGTVNQAGQQIVSRQLDAPPTITIRPGTQVRVLVTRDLIIGEEGD